MKEDYKAYQQTGSSLKNPQGDNKEYISKEGTLKWKLRSSEGTDQKGGGVVVAETEEPTAHLRNIKAMMA